MSWAESIAWLELVQLGNIQIAPASSHLVQSHLVGGYRFRTCITRNRIIVCHWVHTSSIVHCINNRDYLVHGSTKLCGYSLLNSVSPYAWNFAANITSMAYHKTAVTPVHVWITLLVNTTQFRLFVWVEGGGCSVGQLIWSTLLKVQGCCLRPQPKPEPKLTYSPIGNPFTHPEKIQRQPCDIYEENVHFTD